MRPALQGPRDHVKATSWYLVTSTRQSCLGRVAFPSRGSNSSTPRSQQLYLGSFHLQYTIVYCLLTVLVRPLAIVGRRMQDGHLQLLPHHITPRYLTPYWSKRALAGVIVTVNSTISRPCGVRSFSHIDAFATRL